MEGDIYLSRLCGCRKCGHLYNIVRNGLAFCGCNFPEQFSDQEAEEDE